MNMNVQPGISGAVRLCPVDAGSVDIDQLQMRAIKILGAFELIGSLVETARLAPHVDHDHDAFLNNIELVSSTFADLTCDMLDNLPPVTA